MTNAKPANGGFQCLHWDCKAAQRHQVTRASRMECHVCGRKKAEAISPKKENMVEWAREQAEGQRTKAQSGTAMPPGQGKSRAARFRRQANQADDAGAKSYSTVVSGQAAPSPIPVVKSSPALVLDAVSKAVSETQAESRKVGFSQEQADRFAKVAPCLANICDALVKEKQPPPWDETRDPKATVDSFLKDSRTYVKSKELGNVEAEVERFTSATLLFPDSHPQAAGMKKQKEAAEQQLKKLQRDSPTPDLTVASLEEVGAAYKRATQTRQDRTQKAREQALERRQERRKQLDALKAELQEFSDALEILEDGLEEAYAHRIDSQEQYDESVRGSIRTLIQENGGQGDMDWDGLPANWMQEPQKDRHVEELTAQREAMRTKFAETEEALAAALADSADIAREAQQKREQAEQAAARLEEARAEAAGKEAAAVAAAQAAEAEATKAREDLKAAQGVPLEPDSELDPDLMPVFDYSEITAPQVMVLHKAWKVLQYLRWSNGVRVTFAEFGMTGCYWKKIIGDQWASVYKTAPGDTDIVHPQILRLLAFALEKVATDLFSKVTEPDAATTKKRADAVIAALAKRRKCQ